MNLEDRRDLDESDRSASLLGIEGEDRIVEYVVQSVVDGASFLGGVNEEVQELVFLDADGFSADNGLSVFETLSRLAVEGAEGTSVSKMQGRA